MKIFALALALVSTPALAAPCPAEVGKSYKAKMAEIEADLDRGNYPAGGHRLKRADYLAEKVKLGYAQLDAGCRSDARASFQFVWEFNSTEYAMVANQAREALNLLNSKGQ